MERNISGSGFGFGRRATVACATLASVACGGGGAEGTGERPFATAEVTEVTDRSGAAMGSVAFPVSCAADAAREVRLGLALMHNMTYAEAERTFERATELDPDCAIAYWGRAMTYVHPLWPDVPPDDRLAAGSELLAEARARGLPTEREEALVVAAEAYYRDATERDESARLASFAAAWDEAARAHPNDAEIALFRALSMIATAPSGDPTLQRQREAGAIAEAVLEAIPDHPGAHHYVIHAFDAPPLSERALPVARSYGEVTPENSHALHMTSHIFTREGLWDESIAFNRRAADVAWEEPIAGSTSQHHLHAIDYLAYAHLQKGADERAEAVLEHVRSIEGPVVDHAASAYAFAAVEARILLERRRWAEAAELATRTPATIPWDRYPHLEAIPVFARALGAAHIGDLSAAGREADRLAELQAAAAALPDAYDWGTQVEVQKLGAEAWITFAEGDEASAVAKMTQAAELEATTQKNPVTPAEVMPAGELLGDMLSEIGRDAEAIEAYAAALERNRNRLNSLLGAGRAAERMGDEAGAREWYGRVLELAGGSERLREELDRVRAYLSG